MRKKLKNLIIEWEPMQRHRELLENYLDPCPVCEKEMKNGAKILVAFILEQIGVHYFKSVVFIHRDCVEGRRVTNSERKESIKGMLKNLEAS